MAITSTRIEIVGRASQSSAAGIVDDVQAIGLDPSTALMVRSIVSDALAADGVAPLSEQAVMAVSRPDAAVTHILSYAGQDLVGYANLTPGRDDEPAMIEAVVAPSARRRGHGTALISAARECAIAAGPVRIWAHGDLFAARALAKKMDLRPLRELLILIRSLDNSAPDLPPVIVPDGVVLRTYAEISDRTAAESEILRVNNAAFEWHPEQGGWELHDITDRIDADWFDPAGLFLAFGTDGARALLGFHWTKVHADQPSPIGEVHIVGVDPAQQGRGLGYVLTLAGLHYLRDRGLDAVELYVEGDNDAALRTYTRLGFQRHRADIAYG